MREIEASQAFPIEIGRIGEAEAARVHFDVSGWQETYGPGGSWSLLIQRATDAAAYPVVIVPAEDDIQWTVSESDAAVPGYGKAELVYTIGDTVAKSVIYTLNVLTALDGSADPPDPWRSWVNTVLAASETAEEAMEAAQDAAAAAERAAESVHDYSYSDDGDGNVIIAVVEPEGE